MSHFLHYVWYNPAFKICISHGIVDDENLYHGADKYISISEEVRTHHLSKGIYSELVPQPIKIVSAKKTRDTLRNILVIRRHQNEPCPFAFLAEKYDLRYSDPDISIENQIRWADLCITLGRGALESMAHCRPVLVADNREYMGAIGDGYVDSENIHEIAKFNFSGRRFKIPITREWVEGEIAKYNPSDGAFLYDYVKEHHEAKQICGRY